MLTKSEYIELQIASLTFIETIVYNRIFFRLWRLITEYKYRRYVEYMEMKQHTEKARKRTWNKIINNQRL